MAKRFGATHTLNAGKEENLVKAVKKLTGGGADYAFECIGLGKMGGNMATRIGAANRCASSSVSPQIVVTAHIAYGSRNRALGSKFLL